MSNDLLASLKMLVNEGKVDVRRIRKIILTLDVGKNLDGGNKEYIDTLDSLISKYPPLKKHVTTKSLITHPMRKQK